MTRRSVRPVEVWQSTRCVSLFLIYKKTKQSEAEQCHLFGCALKSEQLRKIPPVMSCARHAFVAASHERTLTPHMAPLKFRHMHITFTSINQHVISCAPWLAISKSSAVDDRDAQGGDTEGTVPSALLLWKDSPKSSSRSNEFSLAS